MFIRTVSDLHNEFSIFNLPVTGVDERAVLLLAGDIGVERRSSTTIVPFLDAVAPRFKDVLYIPGNHEYYNGGSINRVDDKLEEVCARYDNVHYMNRKSRLIDGVRFVGCTLWTDFRDGDPLVMMAAGSEMNDYKQIRIGPAWSPYQKTATPADILAINRDHRHFIEHEFKLAKIADEKVVVFTHHSPSMASSRVAKASILDYAYHNIKGLEDLILDYTPVLWVHGHSHYPVDYMLGDTRILNNSRGYANDPDGDEGLGFLGDLTVRL